MEDLLIDGGAENVTTLVEDGAQKIYDADAWWKIVLGAGLRATVEAVGPQLAAQVRYQNQATIIAKGIQAVTTNVIYGVAQKTNGHLANQPCHRTRQRCVARTDLVHSTPTKG